MSQLAAYMISAAAVWKQPLGWKASPWKAIYFFTQVERMSWQASL